MSSPSGPSAFHESLSVPPTCGGTGGLATLLCYCALHLSMGRRQPHHQPGQLHTGTVESRSSLPDFANSAAKFVHCFTSPWPKESPAVQANEHSPPSTLLRAITASQPSDTAPAGVKTISKGTRRAASRVVLWSGLPSSSPCFYEE